MASPVAFTGSHPVLQPKYVPAFHPFQGLRSLARGRLLTYRMPGGKSCPPAASEKYWSLEREAREVPLQQAGLGSGRPVPVE